MLDPIVSLLPPPAFMALATSALLAAFNYPPRRRFPAALAIAALTTYLTDLQVGL